MIGFSDATMTFFPSSHTQQQEENISDALQELLCNEETCDKAHEAIVKAIEVWLNYHQDELTKWTELKRRVTSSLSGHG